MEFNALAGQRLLGVEVFEPWGECTSERFALKGLAPLSGALVLRFDGAALVCTSPLRYQRHQQGTLYGLPSGVSVSLGYRATIATSEEVAALLPGSFRQPFALKHWHAWRKLALPVVGSTLIDAVAVGIGSEDGDPAWGVELRFEGGHRYQLGYRPDLDGSIELDAPGRHFDIEQIIVDGPEQDFGWLHPAAPLDFVLDDQAWRSAHVSDWPWPLRKALQSHQVPEAFYRETMHRALLARFRQRPLVRQRLLALRYPVQVKDVPNGLIEEIAQALVRDP